VWIAMALTIKTEASAHSASFCIMASPAGLRSEWLKFQERGRRRAMKGNKVLALPLKVWVRESLSRTDLAILAFGAAIRNKLRLRLKPRHCLVRDRAQTS
jgi:hypothetical protein